MKRFGRILARVGIGSITMLAAAAFASPAYADTTADLEVKFSGATSSPNTDAKFGTVSMINHGPSAASGITLTFDIGDLDSTKVELDTVGCDVNVDTVECALPPEFILINGADFDGAMLLTKKPGATGDAGKLTVTISHSGTDPVAANNTVTVNVTIADAGGPDLATLALDVYKQGTDPNEVAFQPIPPGGTSNLWVFVVNQGDVKANGVKISITLPQHVSFNEAEPDCTHTVGSSTTVCEYDTVVLDTNGTDESLGFFFFPVKVAADAPGPVALTGGVVTAEAMGEPVEVPSASPRNFTRTAPKGFVDVDPTDNTDEFTVFVAGPTGNGLPQTGVKVGLIAGAGSAVLALGVVLVLAARRRRVTA